MSEVLPGRRALRVWQRNASTYARVWVGNLLGHLADPVFYLAVLGYGLGSVMPPIDGMSYASFLATGVIAGAAMSSACFETSYGSFLRMRHQGTFESIIATPVSVADVAGGEILWAATKGLIATVATFVVAVALLLVSPGWWIVPAVGVVLLQGLFFGGAALAVTARARSLEALNHFYALFIMPVLFLSGVFFPLERLPAALQWGAAVSPLTHAVHLIRPLAAGQIPPAWWLELLWILAASIVGVGAGVLSLRRTMIV